MVCLLLNPLIPYFGNMTSVRIFWSLGCHRPLYLTVVLEQPLSCIPHDQDGFYRGPLDGNGVVDSWLVESWRFSRGSAFSVSHHNLLPKWFGTGYPAKYQERQKSGIVVQYEFVILEAVPSMYLPASSSKKTMHVELF